MSRAFLSIPLALITLLSVACGSSQSLNDKRHVAADDTPAAAASHETAVAEVTRLTAAAQKDPLLMAWTGPYGGVPPWDQATADKFPAALQTGVDLMLAEVQVIATNPEPATFENTIMALEDTGRHLDRALTLFGVLTSSVNTPAMQELDAEWSPKFAVAFDKITFNQELFSRLKVVYDGRTSGQLSAEQGRLVEKIYDRAVRKGAQLSGTERDRVAAINEELAGQFTEFGNKVLADENSWIVLETKKDLKGLSDSLIATYKSAAEEREVTGKWAVVNTRSSVDPFLAASARRDLREKVWKAFKARGDSGNANDTKKSIARIVKLRAERASVLGYESHAHWRMSDTMAKDPAKAMELMMRVWPAAVARVGEEVADMRRLARRDGIKGEFEPWDYRYYAEKVRKSKYSVDDGQIKPYFQLENMIEAAFFMGTELYGLGFEEITGKVPVFHPDVRVWEVTDKASGSHVGLFYGDYFARKEKRSGAWANTYRGHETFTGKAQTPITSNNNNFVRGAADEPVLISLDDSQTLFHEFGHALHSLLSEANYPTLRHTPQDFVEYPSQVHEKWVLSRPVLDGYARHVKTGKPMPAALVAKIERSSTFNQGYATVEYLSSAILDMELHKDPSGEVDPEAFERETLERIGAPREVAMRHRLPQFGHLFSGDAYSAGYYSYLWSEVMDADTREAFAEAGDEFHPETAEKLRKYILAPGDTTDRAEAYRQFRGRDPEVTALLKKRGFPLE